jgi:hypothetical protein
MNIDDHSSDVKHYRLKESLRQELLANLDERIARYQELNFISVIPNTHFASITTECILLYRDGYYFACIALCQAITEALEDSFVKEMGKKVEVM